MHRSGIEATPVTSMAVAVSGASIVEMDGRWLNDDILVHVFAHLTVQEVAQYALTVCKKWRDVALFENHRRLRPEIFEALKASATSRQSPLFRFSMLFERNLLKDAGFNEYPFAHKPPPLPSEIGWQMTKAGCFVVCGERLLRHAVDRNRLCRRNCSSGG